MARYNITYQLPGKISLGLWKIEESACELYAMAENLLSAAEKERYSGFKSERRQREWLATRLLIADMLGRYVPVEYDAAGKPCLSGMDAELSISHAEGIAAVLISPDVRAAVDIERITPRIMRIRNKYLHDSEIALIPENDMLRCLYIHWCAKEAMYKAWNIEGYDYQNSYALCHLNRAQSLYEGRVVDGGITRKFDIHCMDVDGCVVCVAVLLDV